MNKTSRVLVTGHRGLVGAALTKLLFERGYDVYDAGSFDLTDETQTAAVFKETQPTHIFHCAGRVAGIGGNAASPADIFIDNIRINTNIVKAARVCGAEKILCMSSGCVYPDSAKYLYEKDMWSGPPHESEAAYAHAKRAMLAHLEAESRQFKLNFAYVISCNLYGPGDRFNIMQGHVIPSLIAKFHEAKFTKVKPVVWGDGSAIRDFLYVDDAADALITIMLKKKGVINLGSGVPRSIRDIVKCLEALYGMDAVWDKTKPNGQAKRLYETAQLNEIWHGPRIGLIEGITRAVMWYNENCDRARR